MMRRKIFTAKEHLSSDKINRGSRKNRADEMRHEGRGRLVEAGIDERTKKKTYGRMASSTHTSSMLLLTNPLASFKNKQQAQGSYDISRLGN